MFDCNDEVKTILQQRVHSKLLTGYFGAAFNPKKDKFYAATLVEINTVDYADFEYLHEQIGVHSAQNYDLELGRKYNPKRSSYTNKSAKELIENGVYKYFSLTFIGMRYQEQWFIGKSLCFYGDLVNEDSLKEKLSKQPNQSSFWEQSLFSPYELPEYLRKKFEETSYKDAGMEEFKDEPYLVALLKKEKKEKVNQAWRHYFNEDLILPFFERIRIEHPGQYGSVAATGINFEMIFPELKQYTLFCCLVSSSEDTWALNYFVFVRETRKYFKWTYFKPVNFNGSYYSGTLIIDDLKQITSWDTHTYLNSSCTMDDDNFWNNYVFAKNNGEYLYLQEI